MTGTTLDQPTHPILGFARALDGALDRVSSVSPVFMTVDDKRAALLALSRERHRLEALWLRVIAAADLDDVGAVDGSTSTGAWLSHHTHTDRAEDSAQVRLAKTLDGDHPDTLQVLGAGEISAKHAEVIAWALKRLPEDLDPHLLAQAEKVMLEEAHHLTPSQLRIAGKHLLEVVAPDLADELIAQQLQADEQAAYSKVRLSLRNNGDGTTQGFFRLPDLQATMLKAAVEAIIAPRKLGADRIDPATGKRIDYPILLGQGFCELIEHLPVDALPRRGRVPVTLLIGLDHQVLAPALGGLDAGCCATCSTSRRAAQGQRRHRRHDGRRASPAGSVKGGGAAKRRATRTSTAADAAASATAGEARRPANHRPLKTGRGSRPAEDRDLALRLPPPPRSPQQLRPSTTTQRRHPIHQTLLRGFAVPRSRPPLRRGLAR